MFPNLDLPPVVYLSIAAGLTIASAVLAILRKKDSPIGRIVAAAQQMFVVPERVAGAAKELLSRVGVSTNFAAWVADTLASLLMKVPAFSQASEEHLRSAVASLYADLPAAKAAELVSNAPPTILASKFARKTFATEYLKGIDLRSIVELGVRDGK